MLTSLLAPRLLTISIIVLSLVGCGVRLNDTGTGTELFKSIELTGDRSAGVPLTLTVTLNPAYPIPVQVGCYYEDGDHLTPDQQELDFAARATVIGQTVLPPAAESKPSEKVTPQQLSYQFTVPEGGSYFLACQTPASPENGMGMSFTIAP